MLSVLVIDDHYVVGQGAKNIIEMDANISVDILSSYEALHPLLKERSHDVYLVDLEMPDKSGVEVTKEILNVYPEAKVIIYTGHNVTPYFNRLVESGVSGMMSKTAERDTVLHTIRAVVQGQGVLPVEILKDLRYGGDNAAATQGANLDEKGKEILIKVDHGEKNEEIAKDLFLSKRSIEYTLGRIYKDLDVKNRIEAVRVAKEKGLIPK
jgi:two-component system competent response regulator ComA